MVTYTGVGLQSITLTGADVLLNKTGSAKGTVTVSTPAGGPSNVRINTITSVSGDGTLGISLKAGTAISTNVLKAAAAGPSATVVVDNTAPVVKIGSPIPTSGIPGLFYFSVDYLVTITEANLASANLTLADVALADSSGRPSPITATKVRTQLSATQFKVSLSNFSGPGAVGIALPAGIATDPNGNASTAPARSFALLVLPSGGRV